MESNEWVDVAQHREPHHIDQATQQRNAVGEQLELAHEEREQVVKELQSMVDRFGEIAGSEGTPPRTQMPSQARKKRRFGRD